jgi:2-polyprenyl-6-methoxyphenol hydroxylase-like FAD-dependent oxidoreductase
MNTDVLVVGAGPTGLMLANQLGRRGIDLAIIDRHSGLAQQTRAMAVQARTLEMYAQLFIAEQALELGRRGEAANLWANGKRTARIPLGDMFLWRRGFHLFFPMRGRHRWRVIGILPPHLRDKPDLSVEALIPEIRDEAGANLAFQA